MLLIEHRVNTLEKLRSVPSHYGVEIDIRDYDGELRCVHDPFLSGEPLGELLAGFSHALAIFNVKCDGLEKRISDFAERYKIANYFFLDSANPTLVYWTRKGERRMAVRFSEFEPIEFCLSFAGKVDWVWIDCFTHLPLNAHSYRLLKEHFKLCIVSPELQGHPRSVIADYRKQLETMQVDAVCSDFCEDWK